MANVARYVMYSRDEVDPVGRVESELRDKSLSSRARGWQNRDEESQVLWMLVA